MAIPFCHPRFWALAGLSLLLLAPAAALACDTGGDTTPPAKTKKR